MIDCDCAAGWDSVLDVSNKGCCTNCERECSQEMVKCDNK